MQKITPFLWFDNNAEEAMKFYTSVFKNSKIGKVTLYPEGSPGPAGTVMVGSLPDRRAGIHCVKRWPGLQIYRSHIICGELRDPGRGG